MYLKQCCTLLIVIGFSLDHVMAGFEDQAKIYASNGHIIFESAMDKNITFYLKGGGHVNIGSQSIDQLLQTVTKMMLNGRASLSDGAGQMFLPTGGSIADQVQMLSTYVGGPFGLIKRVEKLEQDSSTRNVTPVNPRISALARRIRAVETKLTTLQESLQQTDYCRSGPCQHGGTCLNMYNSFLCLCPSNWEGQTCTTDVNECAQFAGTDLGCQNGASCQNQHGGYSCICADGWRGIHCNTRTQDCATSGAELCGHGACVQSKDGYRCICDQGWKTNGVTPACNVDVDECSESRPHCSKDPEVSCINLPGSFVCGACPAGYTGNGFYCVDINECETNNGGCSTAPSVPCINTRGSFRCGSCPAGYAGDGKTCLAQGSRCTPGLCHAMARCVDYGSATPNCVCLPGYTGSGFGVSGCIRSSWNPCASAPCRNGGTCVKTDSQNFSCLCPPDTNPPLCMRTASPCESNPCQNGGTCAPMANRFVCRCPPSYTGLRCQVMARACGGIRFELNGTLRYPESNGTSYNHNARCAWLIKTNETQVLNVTFSQFRLENPVASGECKFDWLQIHDGRSSAAHMIGRFCGNRLPHGGNFISSHDMLYLWFRSDNSTSHEGFTLHWQSIDPVCGGPIGVASHGVIASPGTPGNYPPNRDCKWYLRAEPGRRILFTFFTMKIESHENCQYDFLQITDGVSDDGPLLAKYCNTSHPEPLTSLSNEATVYFHSDEDGNDAGFQISYAVVEGVPGCGGKFTQREGTISSPLSQTDNVYPNNLNCEYLISLPIGSRVEIQFTKFHLEASEDCKFDYLEVFDGRTTDDPSLGKFCGDRLPAGYTSTGNVLLLKFRTDWSAPKPGFSLTYKIKCGGTFNDPEQELFSPSYPSMYPANQLCDYVIHAPLGKAIELEFQDFDIEKNSYPKCDLDYVELYDGMVPSNQTLLGRWCSTKPPPRSISTKNVLLMRFVTDGSVAGRGFKANFTFFNISCGGVLTREDMIIRSPAIAESGKYQHNARCEWIIVAPAGHAIQLSWNSFELELSGNCVYDYVEIFDNSTLADSLVGRYCGSQKPPVMTSSGTMITIRFVTDSSSSKDGFSVAFTFMDVEKSCGGNFFTTNGIIRSPGWPNIYPSNKVCEWVINVPMGMQIQLLVSTFVMEKHRTCRFDGLTIRNGGTENSPLIGTFCGEQDFNGTISFGHQLYLRFFSDSSRNYKGFMIEWAASTTGCGGVLTAPKGSIISPNYPFPYGQSTRCSWRITASQGSAIHIVFTDLDMESHRTCQYDYLDVYDGYDIGGTKLGRFCTTEMEPLVLNTVSNHAYLRMRTDDTNHGRGFQLKYNVICKRNITGYAGVIESPNFPNVYPPSMDCQWTISVPRGNRIRIEFSHFDLESIHQGTTTSGSSSSANDASDTNHRCPFDYVKLREIGASDLLIERSYCASRPPSFVSLGNTIDVIFRTDNSGEQMGFRLDWTIEGCGGQLSKPIGSLSTPNYPQPYPKETECLWTIVAQPGQQIELTVQEFHMETSDNCRFDGLMIANDANYSQLITTVCHEQTEPIRVVSAGHVLYVKFYSDSSYSYRGFTASYRTKPAVCGGMFLLHEGSFTSPNYPATYPMNASCEWLIKTDASHTLQFKIDELAMERSPNCTSDALRVYDGSMRADNKLLLTVCGPEPNITSISSIGHELLVTFDSNDQFGSKGFKASYATNCGSRIVANAPGTIQLKNAHKTKSDNCTWVLVAPQESQHITLTIGHMSIMDSDGDCYATIAVYEGEDSEGPARFEGCGNRVPPSIVSRGNALTVVISSADLFFSKLDNVFVEISYTTLDNACGGRLGSLTGEIASPNYPDSYPANVECVWEVVASPGNKISLYVQEIDIVPSDDCNGDYLEVREQSADGTLMGDFCGTVPPTNLTSASSLWIKFRSAGPTVAKGFLAEYSYDLLSELSGVSGTISSPLYPRSYSRSEIVSWRISVELGSVIAMSFTKFAVDRASETPAMCDGSLTIYDGYDDGAAVLLAACGYVKPDPVTSTTNVVYVVLDHTDVMDSSSFALIWQQKVASSVASITAAVNTELFCGGHSVIAFNDTDTVYNVTSPGYPYGYMNGQNCSWIFQSTIPTYHPFLFFDLVDLEESSECVSDYVEVFGSSDLATWKSYGRICTYGYRVPRTFHGAPHLRLDFRTDYFLNRTGFAGKVLLRCGGYLTDPNGVITQPSASPLPNTWPTRMIWMDQTDVCSWNISVRAGRTIEFRFEQLNISSSGARPGSVTIRNGIDEYSPMIGVYSGIDLPSTLTTVSNRAFVRFRMSSGGPSSFRLVYRELSVECGGNVLLKQQYNSVLFTTPNYPSLPPPHSECIWTVLAPAGELLQLKFLDDPQYNRNSLCQREYVVVRDGLTQAAPELLHSCSNDLTRPVVSTTNALMVKYFNELADSKGPLRINVTLTKCGGFFRATSGTITSKNYPLVGGYPASSMCEYHVQLPGLGSVELTFQDLHLPGKQSDNCTDSDNVQLYAVVPGANETGRLHLGTFCGSQVPALPITSIIPNVMVVFTTFDHNTIFRGFKLNYALNYSRCSHSIRAQAGEVTSPGYGTQLTPQAFCEWRITVPEGRRVRLEFLDFDLEMAPDQFNVGRLSFYDGANNYGNRIKMITSLDDLTPVYSSGNQMLVQFYSRSTTGRRGFKLRFSSDEPTICNGNLNGLQGTIETPANASTLVCSYRRTDGALSRDPEQRQVGTLAMNFREVVSGPFQRMCIEVTASTSVAGGQQMIKRFCSNSTTPQMLLSPFPSTAVHVHRGGYMNQAGFKMDYVVHECGGRFGPSTVNISRPQGNFGRDVALHCAWHVTYPEETLINITKGRFAFKLPCEQEYLMVYNGALPSSPLLGRFCKDQPLEGSFATYKHQLFVEYHTTSPSAGGDFELRLASKAFGCGGTIHSGMAVFSAPLTGSKYRPNVECVWVVRANEGQHVGITFIDRFSIEKSPNCSKDSIELFDQVRGDWVSLGRICGKALPGVFNSTGTTMKIVFRTDNETEGDGFTIRWESNCGGIFYADDQPKTIVSPNYPENYNSMQVCNYTILANKTDANIEVNFLDFELEDTLIGSVCRYDNLTIYRKQEYIEPLAWEKIGTYCRKTGPTRFRLKDRTAIIFQTDRYLQARGFRFEYRLSACGGNISSTTRIHSPENLLPDGTFRPAMICRWYIAIPSGQKVTVRFESLTVEHTTGCYFDAVEVYKGLELTPANRLAMLCGNLTAHAPAVPISGSHGVVSYKMESFSSSTAQMSALILYSVDCDKTITLDDKSPRYNLNVLGSGNDRVQDCHYTFEVPVGYTVQVTFEQFHVGTSRNRSDCTDDYVELRDGGSGFADQLGRYCGARLPPVQTSSGPTLYLRYVTDSALQGTLFEATVTMVPSLCGPMVHNLTEGRDITLNTPMVNGKYPPNVKCLWLIKTSSEKQLELDFLAMDLQSYDKASGECKDYIGIRDYSMKTVIYEGLGENVIFNGRATDKAAFYSGTRYATAYHMYCGSSVLPSPYISMTNQVYVKFESDSAVEGKGVSLHVRESSVCARNYTRLQGRILQSEVPSKVVCTITIQVPVNYTIAVYFNNFYLYNVECDKHGLKVFDGMDENATPVIELCNFVTPNPVFSTGNVLRFVMPATQKDYATLLLDATYVATDQGQGCGGEVYNYGGILTSPLYPFNNRTRMQCSWTVSVPNNLVVALRFETFDLGSNSTCATDYLQVYDRVDGAQEEMAVRKHCGNDKPANYVSSNSQLRLLYKKTQNFAGVGWMIKFMGVEAGTPVQEY
ncbi:cubilin homolog [Anopheles darlingi]|uniref:cubilin homolog n=1 Tax=Anopheles darlingi TaxID=43151 RepID=UPI0021006696|nr:cubilin homolog [Anopheles darlingi]